MAYIVRVHAENDSESRVLDSTPFTRKRDSIFVMADLYKAVKADNLTVTKMETIKQ